MSPVAQAGWILEVWKKNLLLNGSTLGDFSGSWRDWNTEIALKHHVLLVSIFNLDI